MVNKPKQIGTAAETAVVRHAKKNGFPDADRLTLTGTKDRGDVALNRSVMIEVKSGRAAEDASDAQILAWMDETVKEQKEGQWPVAFLVTKRKGKGTGSVGQWWAHFWLSDLYHLRGAQLTDDIEDEGDAPVRMTFDSALAQIRATFGIL